MMLHKQRGVGFVGLIMIAATVVFVAILGMKLIPSYTHSFQIAQIFKAMAKDPELANASVMQIRSSFSKRADVNNISDISAEDIEISKDDGQLSLSTNYTVKIPLVGNATLVLEFNPSSS